MKLINQLEDQLNKIKEKEKKSIVKIDYDNPKPIDGKLHPLHQNKELIEKNAFNHSSSPFVLFENHPPSPTSHHYAGIIKDLKKNLKKTPNIVKSTLLNETYNKKLLQIASLKSRFPGFGPKNLCGNKEFINRWDGFGKFETKIVEAALLNKIIKKEKVAKSIISGQASEWDKFISSEGEKIFNTAKYFLPLKEFYYEQTAKEAEARANWNYEDAMREISTQHSSAGNNMPLYFILGIGILLFIIIIMPKSESTKESFESCYKRNTSGTFAMTPVNASVHCKKMGL